MEEDTYKYRILQAQGEKLDALKCFVFVFVYLLCVCEMHGAGRWEKTACMTWLSSTAWVPGTKLQFPCVYVYICGFMSVCVYIYVCAFCSLCKFYSKLDPLHVR